ncbi:hypothetical protein ElyMa_003888100 [Elysia marginata]|uniref:Uncharacterized protein n=1 Tax=Elysia marginata TaxID=1093978 RepID=A0AAV4FLV4_9GAST|nr:hypothetical protein ElyMa_003888100 [Elysia marginata]
MLHVSLAVVGASPAKIRAPGAIGTITYMVITSAPRGAPAAGTSATACVAITASPAGVAPSVRIILSSSRLPMEDSCQAAEEIPKLAGPIRHMP